MAPIQSKAKLNKQTKTKPGAVLWFDWHRNLGAIYLVGAIAEFFCNDVKQAYFLDIRKKTQGVKNSKLKRKTQNSS